MIRTVLFSALTFILALLLETNLNATTLNGALIESSYDISLYSSKKSELIQGQGKGQKGKKHKNKEGKRRLHPFSELKVPKGHLPPPGKCTIWYPNTPPGHQPAPQSCASALREVPLGAWVINHEGNHYRVNIFNRKRSNVIDEILYFDLQ